VQQSRSSRRAKGDRTRAALVDAGMRLFDTLGVEQTSVDQIVAAARVAKGTFYVHFEHKTDVLLERAAGLISALTDAGLPHDAPDALIALGDRVAAEMSAQPRRLMGRMVREIIGNREDWIRVLGRRPTLNSIILPIVEQGRAAGELRRDLSARRTAQGLTILWLDAVIGWSERRTSLPLEEDLRRATALFLVGAQE
jgi:AcrR family transcriptional regulator